MQKNTKTAKANTHSSTFPIITAIKCAIFGFLLLLISYSVFAILALKSDSWTLQGKTTFIAYGILAFCVFLSAVSACAFAVQFKLPCALLTSFIIMLLTFAAVVVVAGGPLKSTTCLIIIPVCTGSCIVGWLVARNIKRRR